MSGLIGTDLPFYLKISKNDQVLVFKIVLKSRTIALSNYLINRENDFPSMLRNLIDKLIKSLFTTERKQKYKMECQLGQVRGALHGDMLITVMLFTTLKITGERDSQTTYFRKKYQTVFSTKTHTIFIDKNWR